MNNQVSRIALADIAEYDKGRYEAIFRPENHGWDTWFVSASSLDTKENRALNRALGIHTVNKTNNANHFKNQKS